MSSREISRPRGREKQNSNGRAAVLRPWLRDRGGHATRASAQTGLEEGIGLAQSISLSVIHSDVIAVKKPRAATLFGSGAVGELADLLGGLDIDLVVVDASLTPIQQRNLETEWNCKVIDRTGLILEIFGDRARTREGQLQVELAALTFQRSRLVRSWTHLERQRGALGFVGGPGERQLEIDRRLIGERITKLRRRLVRVRRTRSLHREARARVPYPVVALVGYTNAGKSTLFNRLTGADTFVHQQLFATLDPTMRALTLPSGREVIASDTVGFISDLPTDLVAAFSATLEELTSADLVIHVRDISHPNHQAQKKNVEAVLAGLARDPADGDRLARPLEALNKIDLLTDDARRELLRPAGARNGGVAISAVSGEGVDTLLQAIDARLAETQREIRVDIPLGDGANIAWLYRRGTVVQRHDDETFAHLTVRLDDGDLKKLSSRPGVVVAGV